MAKRNNTRRANRKDRRANRKSRKDRKSRRASASRKDRKTRGGARRSVGVFGYVYNPVSHVLKAAGEATRTVTNTTGNIVTKGIYGVNSLGRTVTGRANAAVSSILTGKSRKNRKAGRR